MKYVEMKLVNTLVFVSFKLHCKPIKHTNLEFGKNSSIESVRTLNVEYVLSQIQMNTKCEFAK